MKRMQFSCCCVNSLSNLNPKDYEKRNSGHCDFFTVEYNFALLFEIRIFEAVLIFGVT